MSILENYLTKIVKGYFMTSNKLLNPYLVNKFQKDFQKYKAMSDELRIDMPINWGDRFPCIGEDTKSTSFDPHYVYHTAWAANILAKLKPKKHIDISSYLYFGTIISAFIPVDFYDFRPALIHLKHYKSKKCNLLDLPFSDNSISSISSMHVIEHIGLGRYGDKLDPQGDLKAVRELTRVLKIGGTLLVVVPVGKPRVVFNAHRIYDYQSFINYFNSLQLREFALIPDNGGSTGILVNPPDKLIRSQSYGCGCFWLKKVC